MSEQVPLVSTSNIDEGPIFKSENPYENYSPSPRHGAYEEDEPDLYSIDSDTGLERPKTQQAEKLGMVDGVMIPVMLSIWGVILFLRLGVLVGQAGFIGITLIFSFGYLITTLTIISISAIVTNGKVKGGGVYYVISRSLGPELGGSIGIIYAISNVFAGGLYVVGFVETLIELFPSTWPAWTKSHGMKFVYGFAIMIFLTIICLVGTDLFAKTNLMILMMLIVAIGLVVLSLLFQMPGIQLGYTGLNFSTLWNNLQTFNWQIDYENPKIMFSTQYAFGILFPSCTGIMVGANMSGDLKNPGYDIPTGTLLANIITYISYIALALLLSFTVGPQTLVQNPQIMMKLSFFPGLITMGIFAATLSSALGSIIGCSRIIQAIARDELVPFLGFFKKGSGANDEPRRATIFIFFAILGIVAIGELNAIAPVVTVLIALTYSFVNFSCFFLSITGAPNFRPTFRLFSWHTALGGAILSIFAIFYVEPIYAGISIIVQGSLMVLIHFYAPNASWGDFSQALIYHQVRKYLLRIDSKKQHLKNWRLQVMLLVSNPRSSLNIIDFVNSLKKGGLFLVGHVKIGEFRKLFGSISTDYDAFEDYFKLTRVKAFPDIAIADSVRVGVQNLVTNSGLGGMRPNTVIMGMYDNIDKPMENEIVGYSKHVTEKIKDKIKNFSQMRDSENPNLTEIEYVQIIRDCQISKKHVAIARHFYNLDKSQLTPSFWGKLYSPIKKDKNIDMWVFSLSQWLDDEASAHLMLQLGHLLHGVGDYLRYHNLRLMTVVDDYSMIASEKKRLSDMLVETRISGTVDVFSLNDESKKSNRLAIGGKCFQGDMKNIDTITKYKTINAIVKKNSQDTSVLFLPLPPVPTTENENNASEYLAEIHALSDNLPPCLLVNANESVISLEF